LKEREIWKMLLQVFMVKEPTSLRPVYSIGGQFYDAQSFERVDYDSPPRLEKIEGFSTPDFRVHPQVMLKALGDYCIVYPVESRLIDSSGSHIIQARTEPLGFVQITAVSSVFPLVASECESIDVETTKSWYKNGVPSSILPSTSIHAWYCRMYGVYPVECPDMIFTHGKTLPIRSFSTTAKPQCIDPLIQPYFGSNRSNNRGVTALDEDGQLFVMRCWVEYNENGEITGYHPSR